MWPDIVALHVAACWLDPTLKAFSFITDWTALLKQAQDVVREVIVLLLLIANELNC